MGLLKALMLQQEAQGWSFSDGNVCTRCVDDDALEDALSADENPDVACDFCGKQGAAPLDTLVGTFVRGILHEYADADNEGVAWESAEGGYQWPTLDTYDLVQEFEHVLVGDGLVEAVQRAIVDRAWVEKDFIFRRRDTVLSESWERFSHIVKHETRYVFWLTSPDDEDYNESFGEVPAARILNAVGELVERAGLLETLPAGFQFWRARTHNEPSIGHPADLGTVPLEKATRANRMNPAGIPMFYGSRERQTAILEVETISAKPYTTVGLFETIQPCTIANFANILPVPSLFDTEWGGMWRQFKFLHQFAEQLSLPTRATHDQIDYVPTQIFTEYVLRVLNVGDKVAGLLFRSALGNGTDIVLDVANERCIESGVHGPYDDRLWLRLEPGSVETWLRST